MMYGLNTMMKLQPAWDDVQSTKKALLWITYFSSYGPSKWEIAEIGYFLLSSL